MLHVYNVNIISAALDIHINNIKSKNKDKQMAQLIKIIKTNYQHLNLNYNITNMAGRIAKCIIQKIKNNTNTVNIKVYIY